MGTIPVAPWFIAVYVGFVVTGTLLVGILPPLVNLPVCDPKDDAARSFVDVNLPQQPRIEPEQRLENVVPGLAPNAKFNYKQKREVKADSLNANEQSYKKFQEELEPKLRDNPFYAMKRPKYRGVYDVCPELTTPEPGVDYPWYFPRLPTYLKPVNYYIEVAIEELGGDVELGESLITFDVTEPTDLVLLHSGPNEFIFVGALKDNANNEINITCSGKFDKMRNDYLIIRTDTQLLPANGPFKVEFIFIDYPTKTEEGIFFLDYGGSDKLVATRFSPIEARRAFPLFDEPGLKATYDIVLYHKDTFYAIGNMPIKQSIPSPDISGVQETTLDTTPALSSYLIGFFSFSMNDFDQINTDITTVNGPVKLTLWARKPSIDQGYATDALNMCQEILNALLNILKDVDPSAIPPKIDVFAIPDYPVDALSHYGLAVFKESKLLHKRTTASERDQQNVAFLIAKTFAEFWFGNFVTMNWWDELWLQEGFADYMKYRAVDAAYPTWNALDQFITEEMVPTLISDGFPSSHPIYKNIVNPYEIEEYFDDIESSKAAAIVRWVEKLVGTAQIDQALTDYLNASPYGLGNVTIYYQTLGTISGKNWPAKDFYDRWLLQSNYPLLSAEIVNATGVQQIKFSQSRALITNYSIFGGPNLYPSPYGYVWYIPTRCEFATGPLDTDESAIISFDIEQKTETYDLPPSQNGLPWIMVNCDKQFEGFYESLYTQDNWNVIATALENQNALFTPEDRANIIHNLFLNAFSERGSYFNVRDALDFLAKDFEYLPWRAAYIHIRQLLSVLEYKKPFYQVSVFFSFVVDQIENNGNDLWTPNNLHLEDLWKETVASLACFVQDFVCLSKTAELWEDLKPIISNGNYEASPWPAYAREIVYNYHIQNTYDVGDWYTILFDYENTIDESEQRKLLEALSFTKLTWLLDEMAQNREKFPRFDFFEIFRLLSENPISREIVWIYFQLNYINIQTQFGKDDPRIGQLLINIAKTFDNEFQYYELLEFVFFEDAGATLNARYKALEFTTTNIIWYYDKRLEIEEAFAINRKDNAASKHRVVVQDTDDLKEFKTSNNAASFALKAEKAFKSKLEQTKLPIFQELKTKLI